MNQYLFRQPINKYIYYVLVPCKEPFLHLMEPSISNVIHIFFTTLISAPSHTISIVSTRIYYYFDTTPRLMTFSKQLFPFYSLQVLKYTCTHLYQSGTPLLRQVLQKAISDYPECSELLDDYLDIERRSHVTTRVRQLFTCQLQNVTSDSRESEKHNSIKERLAVQSILFELEKLHTLDSNDGKLHCRGSVKTKPFGLRRRVFQLGGWISGLSLVSLR